MTSLAAARQSELRPAAPGGWRLAAAPGAIAALLDDHGRGLLPDRQAARSRRSIDEVGAIATRQEEALQGRRPASRHPSAQGIRLGAAIAASVVLHLAAAALLTALGGAPATQFDAHRQPMRVVLAPSASEDRPAPPRNETIRPLDQVPAVVAPLAADPTDVPPATNRHGPTDGEGPPAPLINAPVGPVALPSFYLPSRDLDVKPRPRDEILPLYPEHTSEREASVVLRLFIAESGAVDRVEVISESLDPAYAQNASAAFSQAQFLPGKKNGLPVKCEMTIVVDFRESRRPPNPD